METSSSTNTRQSESKKMEQWTSGRHSKVKMLIGQRSARGEHLNDAQEGIEQ